jgi:uncharacterized protein (DUF885 family)
MKTVNYFFESLMVPFITLFVTIVAGDKGVWDNVKRYFSIFDGRRKNILFLILLSILFTSCSNTIDEKEKENLKLNNMLENYIEEKLRLFPLIAAEVGDHRYDDQYTNEISSEHRIKQQTLYSKYLNKLSDINLKLLDSQAQLSYDIFKYDLELEIERLQFNDHLIPIHQMSSDRDGPVLQFIQLGAGAGTHPFKTVSDYENFLNRVSGFQKWVDTAIENMRVGIKEGIVQPKVIIEKTIPQLKSQLVEGVEKSMFYNPIQNFPSDFEINEQIRLKNLYSDAIKKQIIPIYRKLTEFLKNEYLPYCRDSYGFGKHPNGKNWYANRVKMYTTSDITPDEIYDIGIKEVLRIGKEMDSLQTALGFNGTRKTFYDYLTKETIRFSSEDELLAEYNRVKKVVDNYIPEYFTKLPNSAFEIRSIEKFRERYSSDYYQLASPDGSRPGIFYLNTYGLETNPLPVYESLYLHEAIPGHHFQFSLQMERIDLPRYRRYYWNSVYGEGWALYTESLGKKLGLYTTPYQYAMRLAEHSKAWTKEKAIQYYIENDPAYGTFAELEIERYIALPGQAVSYKIGEIKILKYLEKAKHKLVDSFDIKAFHNEILKDGAMPLQIFEAKLNNWIEKKL